ncbi:MAG: hypothetical protein WD556_03275 [Actinomycetota bacterium]
MAIPLRPDVLSDAENQGRNLTELRRRKGDSQREVIAALSKRGVESTQAGLSLAETGRSSIRSELLFALAEHYRDQAEDLPPIGAIRVSPPILMGQRDLPPRHIRIGRLKVDFESWTRSHLSPKQAKELTDAISVEVHQATFTKQRQAQRRQHIAHLLEQRQKNLDAKVATGKKLPGPTVLATRSRTVNVPIRPWGTSATAKLKIPAGTPVTARDEWERDAFRAEVAAGRVEQIPPYKARRIRERQRRLANTGGRDAP